jgi:hypothetical protein
MASYFFFVEHSIFGQLEKLMDLGGLRHLFRARKDHRASFDADSGCTSIW